jgi:hypothetical protein
MKEQDIQRLDEREQRVLDLSFRHSLNEYRVRNIVLSTVFVMSGVVLFVVLGLGALASMGIAILVLLISMVEKIFYAKEMLDYKALVRKLTHRIEQLEGTKLTPDGAHPVDMARQQTRDDSTAAVARSESGFTVPRPSARSESSASK